MRLPPIPILLCAIAAVAAGSPWCREAGAPPALRAPARDTAADAAARDTVAAVRFVPNRGQWHEAVEYAVLGDTAGWLHRDGFTLRYERSERTVAATPGSNQPSAVQTGCVLRTRFLGAATTAVVAGDPLPGVNHFLLGASPERWRSHVPGFATVRLTAVQPGIDVVFRPLPGPAHGAFEYDLVLAPGADLARFTARCEGAEALRIDADGRLCVRLATPEGSVELVQQAPVSWQDSPAGRRPVAVAFRLLSADTYGFLAADLDAALATTIDPGVVWSTYLGGGSSDSVNDLEWRPGQGVWIAGWAGSTDFPTTVGAYRTTGQRDGFVARLNETGSALQYGTYLGGGLIDEVRGLDLNSGLQPTVVGFTRSLDFPVTAGAWQPNFGGASLVVDIGDAFVARLSAAGDALLAGTYLGGMFDDVAEAVAVDAAGNAWVAGWTNSPNFPTTAGAWQPVFNGPVSLQTDGFVCRLAANAQSAAYSTFVGGTSPDELLDVALDAATGDAVVAGWSASANFPVTATAYRTSNAGTVDMVVVRLNAAGSAPVFSTYLGGLHEDFANAVALAADGSPWIGGYTDSANFPTSANAPQGIPGGGDDGVVCRLSANGQSLPFSTLLGGSGWDQVRGIAVDGTDVLAVGETQGSFPVTGNAAQPLFGGGSLDGFAAHYTGGGASLAYCTYFGGSDPDVLDSVALANSGLAMLGGWSFAADFPVTAGAFQTVRRGIEDGVVLELDLLSDLGDGLLVQAAGDATTPAVVGAGEHDGLVVEATNQTTRELALDAVRLLIAGRGDASYDVQSLAVWLDDPASPGPHDVLVGGPLAVVVDDGETAVALSGVVVPVGGTATLRVVLDLRGDVANGTVEVACSAVDRAAWTVSAVGSGGGPTVRVLGSGRVAGRALVVGALPGDGDGDGELTVFDLRRMCAHVGSSDLLIDTDLDGVLTLADVDFARQAMLGIASAVSVPLVVARGQWFTIQGVFPAGQAVDATLGGRSCLLGCATPRELTLRVDANQPTGLQELQVVLDGRPTVSRTVQVQ